jgi:hypothetical protein
MYIRELQEQWRYFLKITNDDEFHLWKYVGDSKEEALKDAESWSCDEPKSWELHRAFIHTESFSETIPLKDFGENLVQVCEFLIALKSRNFEGLYKKAFQVVKGFNQNG